MEAKCPKCKKRFETPDVKPGQMLQCTCPRCNHIFNFAPSIEGAVAQQTAAVRPVAPVAAQQTSSQQPQPVSQPRNISPEPELVVTHICKNCGHGLPDNVIFCPQCGMPQ